MTDIIDRLTNWNTVYEEDADCDGSLYLAARDEILRLRELTDVQTRILQHTYPDKSGRYFISGHGGDVDENGLPDRVSICPAYGCDWSVIYRRV